MQGEIQKSVSVWYQYPTYIRKLMSIYIMCLISGQCEYAVKSLSCHKNLLVFNKVFSVEMNDYMFCVNSLKRQTECRIIFDLQYLPQYYQETGVSGMQQKTVVI